MRRFTQGGFLVLGGLVVSAALGIDTNRTMAFQIFTFLASLLAFSIASALLPTRLQNSETRKRLPAITVERILPRFAMVGESLVYRAMIRNHTGRVQEGLFLRENPEDPFPSLEEFIQNPEPFEATRNWFDRKVGYYRWQWLISKKRGAVVREQPLPPLPPEGETEVNLELTPLRRGRLYFTGVIITRPDPFGLFKSLFLSPAPQTLLVLPKRYILPPIKLRGGRKYQPGGVKLASKVGDSEEFMSLRGYRPGDPLHRIHWKSWARVGKPVIKEYQEEFFVRHALVMDTFIAADFNEVFEEAVSVAASLVCSVETEESLLDLMFVGAEAHCFTTGRGVAHQDRMMEILACAGVCKNKPFSTLNHLVMGRVDFLSSCICVLLAWDKQRQDFVRQLRSQGISILVLLVTDAGSPHGQDPGPLADKPELFHRLEVGRIAEGLARL